MDSLANALSKLSIKSPPTKYVENEVIDQLINVLNNMRIEDDDPDSNSSSLMNTKDDDESSKSKPPTKAEIIQMAKDFGYKQSNSKPKQGVLYFTHRESQGDNSKKINIHVWYNTKTVMTNINHPVRKRGKVYRKDAYDDLMGLSVYFIYPRVHTDFGYSSKDDAKATCAHCYLKLKRPEFSEKEWRKVGRDGESVQCIECEIKDCIGRIFVPSFRRVQSYKVVQTWANEGKKTMIPVTEDAMKDLMAIKPSRYISVSQRKSQSNRNSRRPTSQKRALLAHQSIS